MQLIVGQGEYANRRKRLLEWVEGESLGAFITFSGLTTFYLTGFHFLPTERPAAAVIPVSGPPILFLPHLEIEHVGATGADAEVITYPEYPGETHPMELLVGLLRERGLDRSGLLAESPGYSSSQGYRGPSLEDLLPETRIVVEAHRVEEMRMIKSPREIELIRESAKWGNLAHVLLQEYCAPGRSENEVSMRASAEASQAMMKTLGSAYLPLGKAGASAGFRGQIGANSALPHAVNINAIMRQGDNLVTGAGSGVGGYGSELERTMFLGEPCSRQRKYFGYMMEMQEAAFAAIAPGKPCSVVDDAVMAIFRERDLEPHWRHHTGHALGLLGHEAPFFDVGDDTVMQAGMVFSVEPGIYVPGLGGFRHSDTVVVTDTGMEFLTYYPRDLESLVIPG